MICLRTVDRYVSTSSHEMRKRCKNGRPVMVLDAAAAVAAVVVVVTVAPEGMEVDVVAVVGGPVVTGSKGTFSPAMFLGKMS